MPIWIDDIDHGRGNIIRGSEVLTGEEVIDALKKHFAQDREKYSRYRYSLSDYTDVTRVDVSKGEFQTISMIIEQGINLNPNIIVSTVGEKDLHFGLLRMLEVSGKMDSLESRVFRSTEEAKEWIATRAKEKYGIDNIKWAKDTKRPNKAL